MTENHKKALGKLKEIHEADNNVRALILYGSLAVGDAGEKSDIDLYLVVSDRKYEQIEKDKLFFYGTWDPDDFFGIEIDGKIINRLFLEKAVAEASEPTRASFEKAYTLFSHDGDIDNLIKKIAVYPEWDQTRRTRA